MPLVDCILVSRVILALTAIESLATGRAAATETVVYRSGAEGYSTFPCTQDSAA